MSGAEIILRIHMSEKASRLMEEENIITVIVERRATRKMIKRAFESIYGVEVSDVRVLITPRGEKKAYVKLSPKHKASDIASRLGLV